MTLQQLSWMDNAFLLGESPRTPGHFSPVIIYDPSSATGGTVTFGDIRARVGARLSLDPTFRRKIVSVPLALDQAYWMEDPDFDLDNHLDHRTLPAPGDWHGFAGLVSEIHSRPLDMSRPLWELTMIDGLSDFHGLPPNCFAAMFKIHHAAVDGAAGVRMLTMLHDSAPADAQEVLVDPWRADPAPSTVGLVARAAVHSVTRPLTSARSLTGHAGRLGRSLVARTGPGLGRPRLPDRMGRTRFNGRETEEKVFDAFRFPMADMKAIKVKVPGATINDVALAIVAGGLRSYLGARGELPPAPLTAAVPVSTREAGDVGSGGNQISMLRTALHTDIADPLERLAAISASTKESKQAREGVSAAVMQDVAQAIPGVLMGLGMKAMVALPLQGPVMAHTGITNVPGSREPLYLAGGRGEWFTGCAPLWDGLTLMHSVGSYRDDFSVQVTACRDVMPQSAEYIDCLRKSYEALMAA